MVGASTIEANLGNVGLLDTTETEIDPAIKSLQTAANALLTTIESLTIERYLELDELHGTDVGDWTAALPTTIASCPEHIPHETKLNAIELDKAGDTSATALFSRTISVDASSFLGPTSIEWAVYHADFANIETVFLRIGTDSSNYHEYAFDPDDTENLFADGVWNRLESKLHTATSQVGAGCNMGAITYIALGATTTAVGNTITDMAFDEVRLVSAPVVTGSAAAISVQTQVNTPNINVHRLGGQPIDEGAGAVANATQRITLASDDPAVAALGPYTTVLAVWTADVAGASETLEEIKTSALSANLKELIMWPENNTDDITWVATGAAGVGSPQVPKDGISLPINKTLADNIELFCTAGANLTIIELG